MSKEDDVKKTVLIVEDEPALMQVISQKLTLSGFTTIKASSVHQAKKELSNHKEIDVIWLDHYLTQEEVGLDLVKFVKCEDTTISQAPIYLVSNTASPAKIHEYLELGVNEYYTKADNKLEDIINDIKVTLLQPAM